MDFQSSGNDDISNIAKKPDQPGKPDNPGKSGKNGGDCTPIKAGSLVYPPGHYLEGQALKLGYDDYGYNYQAHKFNGFYVNAYLGAAGFPPYTGNADAFAEVNPGVVMLWAWEFRDVKLVMKWNDAWLSNTDCDDDGILDRHPGSASYIDSGAQLTNHLTWEDEQGSHELYKKIIAVPGNANQEYDILWGFFAIVEEESNGEGTPDIRPATPRLESYDEYGDPGLPPC